MPGGATMGNGGSPYFVQSAQSALSGTQPAPVAFTGDGIAGGPTRENNDFASLSSMPVPDAYPGLRELAAAAASGIYFSDDAAALAAGTAPAATAFTGDAVDRGPVNYPADVGGPFGLDAATRNASSNLYFADIADAASRGTPAPSIGIMRPAGSQQAAPVSPYAPTGAMTTSRAPSVAPVSANAHRDVFDAGSIRRDFPILNERVANGKPLIWLDNAATTQKPRAVIDRISRFYERENSNIHRAAHELAARATDAYEAARATSARFLNASSPKDIVFVRGTTEAINLVAQSWGRQHIGAGDEILISWLEHHSNIVPWQMLAQERGAKLRVAPVDDRGEVIFSEYTRLLTNRTKLVAITQVSNALGTVVPVAEMTAVAHRHGARVLVDGAQSVSHMPVDVQAIGCDWFVFSGHKVFGPTGIGVLYGRPDVFAESPPWQGGGNMIADVTFEKTVYNPPPSRFEAGTGNIADAVGLGAALDYVMSIGMDRIERHEASLLEYGTRRLREIPGLRLIGTAPHKAAVLGFVIDGMDPVAVGKALNEDGIAVRAGHHCAQPALRRMGYEATVRPSLAIYNTTSDLDALASSLHRIAGSRAR
jgi:cysteine desulfurase/selenocysteine lyase